MPGAQGTSRHRAVSFRKRCSPLDLLRAVGSRWRRATVGIAAVDSNHGTSSSTWVGFLCYRFFPNHDTMPKGGFGNLIALRLQKVSRDFGFTEFLDDEMRHSGDQWTP
jgi:hypothetical protein